MKGITFTVIVMAIGAASFTGGRFMGAYEQAATDQAQALAASAGYYGQQDGRFRFGVPPVELAAPTMDSLTRALPPLPMPKHKPSHNERVQP